MLTNSNERLTWSETERRYPDTWVGLSDVRFENDDGANIESELCPDHIHMLLSIPPKYRYGNRQFWCRGYYVDTVGRNQRKIEEYIRKQLSKDKLSDDISRKELYDPFTGEAVVKGCN